VTPTHPITASPIHAFTLAAATKLLRSRARGLIIAAKRPPWGARTACHKSAKVMRMQVQVRAYDNRRRLSPKPSKQHCHRLSKRLPRANCQISPRSAGQILSESLIRIGGPATARHNSGPRSKTGLFPARKTTGCQFSQWRAVGWWPKNS
jgi:hypothetical protein